MQKKQIIQRADTIHLNYEGSINFNPSDNLWDIKGNMANGVVDYFQLKKQYYEHIDGISHIQVTPAGDADIKISAKLLGENYVEGICYDTIPEIVNVINSVSDLHITTDGILKQSNVKTYDSTYNIKMDEPDKIKDYIQTLQLSAVCGSRATRDGYGDESVVFRKTTKANDVRLIFYDKDAELRLKRNERFFMQNAGKLIDDFTGVLRVENNIRSKAKMRSLFKVHSKSKMPLNELFSSNENVIQKSFANFIDMKSAQKVLFTVDSMDTSLSFGEYAKRQEIKRLLIRTKGDIQMVQKIIATKFFSGDIGRLRNTIKEVAIELQQKKIKKGDVESYSRKFKEVKDKIASLK